MVSPFFWLTGAGVGAGAMYYLDAASGRRRRAMVRDKVLHAYARSAKALDVVRRDAANRFVGTIAELRGALHRERPADRVLAARVRSKLGRATSHPSAIEVRAEDGCVSLFGPVLSEEEDGLLRAVAKVRGVECVENHLHAHPEPSNIAALQGSAFRPGPTLDILQDNWSPTTRMAVGATGAGLLATCLASRSPLGLVAGAVGLGLAVRAIANKPAMKIWERSRSTAPGPLSAAERYPITPDGAQRDAAQKRRESHQRQAADIRADWRHGAMP